VRVEPGEAEEPLRVRGNVCEDEHVTVAFRALLRVEQHVDSGAVDEVQGSEIEHETPKQGTLGSVEFARQSGA
jgi:hypothetical protein